MCSANLQPSAHPLRPGLLARGPNFPDQGGRCVPGISRATTRASGLPRSFALRTPRDGPMGPLLSWTASRLVRRTVPDVHALWGERPTHAAVGGFSVLQRPQGGSTGGTPHSSRGSPPSWRRCDLRVGVRVGGWGEWLAVGVGPGAGPPKAFFWDPRDCTIQEKRSRSRSEVCSESPDRRTGLPRLRPQGHITVQARPPLSPPGPTVHDSPPNAYFTLQPALTTPRLASPLLQPF